MDDVGHDILSQLIYGARISLTFGLVAAVVATMLGAGVGVVAGLVGGIADKILMRLVDVVLALPFLPLLIVIAAFLGRSFSISLIAIAVVIWARPARILRSQVLSVREEGAVQAARSMGAGRRHLLVHHIIPTMWPLLIAQFVQAVNFAILFEASLSFLGLGDPTTVSWGTMLYYATARGAFVTSSWVWWVVPTGLALSLAVVGFVFVGYALEELADPRLRVQRFGPGSITVGEGGNSQAGAVVRVEARTA
jgi:ABC-type dipeptide/oligopeptide/nickel transport system permease subunit